MANIKFSVNLKGSWVIEHRRDKIIPAVRLKEYLKSKYESDASVENVGYSTVKIDYNGVRDERILSLDVIEFFEDFYDVTKNSGVYSLKFENLPEAEDLPPMDDFNSKKDQEFDWSILDEFLSEEKVEKSQGQKFKVIEKCEKLIGFKDFKRFANELIEVIPEIKSNKTVKSFRKQVYLFSINSGYGLSTACSLFAELLHTTGIVENSNYHEYVLPAKKGENGDAFADVLSIFNSLFSSYVGVICIDISEWMGNLNDKYFREFLKNISSRLDKGVVVFRIPFVDKEVVVNVADTLNDLTFVKTVTFAPFSPAEIRMLAKKALSEYGFTINNRAWVCFEERIALEKADGRFYGVKTVKKVVDELLYLKQLTNVRSKNGNKVITYADTKKLLGNRSGGELTAKQLLDKMIGCKEVKNRIQEIIAQIELAQQDKSGERPCIHMRFVGNPGTGKTTVARVIGKLLKEKGVLRVGSFFEFPGRYFCGRFIGETAPKTASICRDAYGSVLFIDEAYTLHKEGISSNDYGKEAIDTLIAEMENHRSDLLVIMAGYPSEMKTLMTANAGLESRMPYVIEFPNFTREELFEIFKSMAKKFNCEEKLFEEVKKYFDSLSDEVLNSKDFSNARFVRNLFERTWAKASMRTQISGVKNVCLTQSDFNLATSDKEFDFNVRKKKFMGFV